MLAQFFMKSGQILPAVLESIYIQRDTNGKIKSIDWTVKDGSYSELKYIDASNVVAVVAHHDDYISDKNITVKKIEPFGKFLEEHILTSEDAVKCDECQHGILNGYCLCAR